MNIPEPQVRLAQKLIRLKFFTKTKKKKKSNRFSFAKIIGNRRKFPKQTNSFSTISLQGDQKENKSVQALQIIGHVVAEVYANKPSMYGRRT
jgi:hypothetical protein